MSLTTKGLIVSVIYLAAIFSAFFTKGAEAGVYVDIGVAVHKYNPRGFQQTEGRIMGSDIGVVEIGYEWKNVYLPIIGKVKNIKLKRRHISVISQYDAGLDTWELTTRVLEF